MIKRCLTSLFATLIVCFLACSSASARVCFLPDSTDCGEGNVVGGGNVEVPCQYSSCPAYNPKYQRCDTERIYNNGGVNVECKQVKCILSKSKCEEQEDNPNSTQCCNFDSASGCYYMGKCPVLCNRNIYDSTTDLSGEDYTCTSCKDKNGTFYNCTAKKECEDINPKYTSSCSDSQTPEEVEGVKDSNNKQCYTCKDKPINQTTCHIEDVSTEQENWENCKYELKLGIDSTIPNDGIDIKAGTSVRVWAKVRGSSTISDIKGANGNFQRSSNSGFKDFVCEAGETYRLYATCGSFNCEEFQLTERKDENCWYCDTCPDMPNRFQCNLDEKPGYKWDYKTNTCKEETCTCPSGYSLDKTSVSSCGTTEASGWTFDSKTVCGKTCGKCTAKTCPRGYGTGNISCTSQSADKIPWGYTYSDVVSGDEKCKKCKYRYHYTCESYGKVNVGDGCGLKICSYPCGNTLCSYSTRSDKLYTTLNGSCYEYTKGETEWYLDE